jgi:hypothetical protein
MAAWIMIDGDINGLYMPLLVFRSEEATRLSEGNAQQVTRSAFDAHREYSWKSVRLANDYIVEGTEKPKAQKPV